jgi:hypothetical protein
VDALVFEFMGLAMLALCVISAGSIRTQAVRPARARFLTQGRFRFPHERIGAAGSLHAIGPRQNGPGGKFKPRFRRKSLDISALSAERPD